MAQVNLVLGVDQVQTDTSHASTVESFFLQGAGNHSELDPLVAEPELENVKKQSSKYAIKSVKQAYSVKSTLDICKKLQAHVQSRGENMQDGGNEKRFSIVDMLLGDAVVCGYMELFAQRTFCSENLAFIMANEMYKAVWNHMDAAAKKKLKAAEKQEKQDTTKSTTKTEFTTSQQIPSSNVLPRGSTLSQRSMMTSGSSKSPKTNQSSNYNSSHNLSTEFKKIPIEELGARLAQKIRADASKIWFKFIDDNGDNQISVDHKSLVHLTARVWGSTPPSNVTSNSSAPDLRQINTLALDEAANEIKRRSSIADLMNLSSPSPNMAEEEEEEEKKKKNQQKTETTTTDTINDTEEAAWLPGPNAFKSGVKLAKKSLENHVVPGFLKSMEFKIYQKRCREVTELLETNTGIGGSSIGEGFRFTGMGGAVWPIVPTTSVLDDVNHVKELEQGSIVYTLDLVLSDRYLFSKFLEYLKSRYCPETLLCYRSLQVFRLTFSDWAMAHQGKGGSPSVDEDSPIEQLSWTVAVFFLSHGMRLEVPVKLSATYTRHLSYKLASPAINMFAKVERACYKVIRKDLFPEFIAHVGVTSLNEHLKSVSKLHSKERKSQKNGSNGKSCTVQ